MTSTSASQAPLALEINNLHGWYGESHVLHGMNLQVRSPSWCLGG